MIELNELRIGNYFEHDDSWNYAGHKGIFQWTDRDWYALGESTLNLEAINPVELTGDVLMSVKGMDCHINDAFPPILYVSEKEGWFLNKKEDYFDYLGIKFKYLHELQNIVFVFRKKELNIKL